jgi:hypothetical protein
MDLACTEAVAALPYRQRDVSIKLEGESPPGESAHYPLQVP